jgi:hypothetical protein
MGVFSKSERLRICRMVYRLAKRKSRFLTTATKTYTEMATQTWTRTAFSEVP